MMLSNDVCSSSSDSYVAKLEGFGEGEGRSREVDKERERRQESEKERDEASLIGWVCGYLRHREKRER